MIINSLTSMPLRCTLVLHPHRHLLWAAKIVKKTYLGDFLHKKSQNSLSFVTVVLPFLPIFGEPITAFSALPSEGRETGSGL